MGFLDGLFQRRLVGLDVGVSGIKAVELQSGERPRLIAYNRVQLPWEAILPDGEVRNKEAVLKALKRLFEASNFSSKRVAIGASGNSVITKKISMQKMSPEDLEHQLFFEAEQYIPFNLDEVNLDFAILGDSENSTAEAPMMDVLLVAAKKDYIQNINALVEEAGLIPEVVDIQAFALGNAFEFNYGHTIDTSPGALCVIIDFGAGSTKISVVEGDKTTFTRELRQCGTSCTLILSEQLGVSMEEAENYKILDSTAPQVSQIVNAHIGSLVEEISRTLDYCVSQGVDRVVSGVFICGGASRMRGLKEALAQKVAAPIHPLNPIQNIAGSGRKMNAAAIKELSFLGAVAIGLSLRMAGDS